ncbi:murein biosynthesis integral membrane protein MurJ [Hankyongella ginsenosidimutans]|uniref:murein biosynthesis integral membrane protein MurJ n=1 Tax=Hankyongella ginsenosidimutans TaxID=1763828 RepID=UPI001CA33D10|nr:lipid II flippase MurJ [Hankyongella ginsenosidimutans]
MAAVVGAGPVADAFLIAFRLPNHFRAIFAEGAFNTAFVPRYAALHEAEGPAPAQVFADRLFTLLLLTQAALAAGVLAFPGPFVRLLAPGLDGETLDLAIRFTQITFPYLLCIALMSLLAGPQRDRALCSGGFRTGADEPVHDRLAAAGRAQAALVCDTGRCGGLGRAGGRDRTAGAGLGRGRPRRHRAPPALAASRRSGAQILARVRPGDHRLHGVQIALFADTIIASFLPSGALSALYYADRLNQLPIGVIGIAAGTVILPTMARMIGAGDEAGAARAQNRTLEMTLLLAAPCVVLFATMEQELMQLLFQRGAFDAAATQAAADTLAAYALGLPAFLLIRSVVASFTARGNTVTPLKASLTALAINLALKVALMGALAQVGLALATSAGWVNVLIVGVLAARRGYLRPDRRLVAACLLVGAAALLMAGGLAALGGPARAAAELSPFLRMEIALGLQLIGGLALYAGVCFLGMRRRAR